MGVTNEHVFLWVLPALAAAAIGLQLRYGRVVVGRWLTMEKAENEGRFWLFIVAQVLLVIILIGQALSA